MKSITDMQKVDEVFKKVAMLLTENKIPWWLEGGSLLGCYREGKRIEGDTDYDLGYPMEYAEKVYEVLSKVDGIFLNWNFYFAVTSIDTLKKNKSLHCICLKPHAMIEGGIYSMASPLKKIFKIKWTRKPGHILAFAFTYIVRKSDLVSKLVIKYNRLTCIPFRFRGYRVNYEVLCPVKMGEVDAYIPIGTHWILQTHYGDDYMIPISREEYLRRKKEINIRAVV
jgi:hypothetical protein